MNDGIELYEMDLNEKIENMKVVAIACLFFSFMACFLTFLFFLNKLANVTLLCSIPFTFLFGWIIGLLHAKKLRKVKKK